MSSSRHDLEISSKKSKNKKKCFYSESFWKNTFFFKKKRTIVLIKIDKERMRGTATIGMLVLHRKMNISKSVTSLAQLFRSHQ